MPVWYLRKILEELELLAEGGGGWSPLTLVRFSLEHRDSPLLKQAPVEAEGITGGSPVGGNHLRDEFIFEQEKYFSWKEEVQGEDGPLYESPPQVSLHVQVWEGEKKENVGLA